MVHLGFWGLRVLRLRKSGRTTPRARRGIKISKQIRSSQVQQEPCTAQREMNQGITQHEYEEPLVHTKAVPQAKASEPPGPLWRFWEGFRTQDSANP